MKVAICYLTNNGYDAEHTEMYNEIYTKLNNSLYNNINTNNVFNIYKLVNVRSDENKYVNGGNTIYFTFNELRKKYNHINRNFLMIGKFNEHRGVCHLPLFLLYDMYPDYDYYAFYEDDVLFTGLFFDSNPFNIINDYYDIIFQTPRIYNPDWFWQKYYDYKLPSNWKPYEGLLNYYIISNKALRDLKEFCCSGSWHGHHELIINSYFYNNQNDYNIGFISDYYQYIGGFDEQQLEDQIHNITLTTNDINIFAYCFLHPIKKLSIYNLLKNIK